MPSASDDPFGAMNAMAQIGTMQRAPEIVIVNDGKPVEQVGASKRTGTIVKYAVAIVVPLGLGILIGQIAKEAKIYNAGIADARKLFNAKDGVKDVKKRLVALQGILEKAEKNGYKPDAETTSGLAAAVTNLEVKQEAVFQTKQNSLNAELSALILNFYAGVAEVRGMLQEHVRVAALDDDMLIAASQKSEDLKPAGYLTGFGDYRYGVLFTAPSATEPGARFGAKLVELGKPWCSDGTQSATFECPNNQYSGVTYMGDQGWTKGEPQGNGAQAEAKKILPLLTSASANGLLKGSTEKGLPGVAEALYSKRLEGIKARVDEVIKTGNSAETRLKPKAEEDDKFSFFL